MSAPSEREALSERIKALAIAHGFDRAGVAGMERLEEAASRYREWLARGYEGEMAYMRRNLAAREDPRALWPKARSALVVAANYAPAREGSASPGLLRGRVARYAGGGDYHRYMQKRLGAVLSAIGEFCPAADGRACVDTAPLLERELAVRAGIGWAGKNTLVLSRSLGSYFFLGVLLLNLDLAPDRPEGDHCGSCTHCLPACPTGAFIAPDLLDARRCISYLTIELRGPIPRELRPLVGDWVFGCDVCQEVCPWNREAPPTAHERFLPRPGQPLPDLLELLELTEAEFLARFRGTALMRAKYSGLLRNAAVALGNRRDPRAVPFLVCALRHREPLVRGHAAWALGEVVGGGGGAVCEPGGECPIRRKLLGRNPPGARGPPGGGKGRLGARGGGAGSRVLPARLLRFDKLTAPSRVEGRGARPVSGGKEDSMARARVRGVELFYLDRGEGVPILWVHGYSLDHTMWEPQVEALSDCRHIAPDLRGHGETP
ncbi:MAG: tRNA epoxyqueuosine(34) reductase QueG, partial [Nitrospinota bacterium]